MKFSVLILSLSLLTCKKDESSQTGIQPPLPAQTINNVSYGADPAQKMDIFLPQGRSTSTTRVMLLIHGGGWNQGDKSDFTVYMDELKKRLPGYAIFNINYRLATGTSNFFPSQENDVKSAIEFIYSKRSEYKISDTYALLGASAGAHLALLHAYKYSSPVKIKAVVDFFGPTELTALYNSGGNPLIPMLLNSVTGGSPTSNPAIYQQSSPYNFVSSSTPPTIILHGGLDPVVPVSQSTMLRDHLTANAIPVQYVFYPSEGHGWTGPRMVDSFNKIVAFLNEHVIL